MDSLTQWLECKDGAKLFVRRWIPGNNSRAIIQIVHGMAEHSARYEWAAQKLCEIGFEVWAADQRGHGLTADLAVNDPSLGGLLGHCADKNGFTKVIADVDIIFDAAQKEHPDLPLFLLGHSWGSFISHAYIENHGKRLAGCVLSGTKGRGGFIVAAGSKIAACIAGMKGSRKKSPLLYALADGSYDKPFAPNRTAADWLSRDEKMVDAYIADPLCGKMCSSGFYRDLTGALNMIYKAEAMKKIPLDLPLYVFCGSADPVGEMGEGPTALIGQCKKIGLKDIEFTLYPDGRHEMLNETNRDEVMGNLIKWLEKHLGGMNNSSAQVKK
jgi:alpha-beta hydrolase superfamily lysophospholipase